MSSRAAAAEEAPPGARTEDEGVGSDGDAHGADEPADAALPKHQHRVGGAAKEQIASHTRMQKDGGGLTGGPAAHTAIATPRAHQSAASSHCPAVSECRAHAR